MSFPNLIFEEGASYHASAEGVPDNGENTIRLPFREEIIDPDRLELEVTPLVGGSVIDASLVSVDEVTGDIVVDFIQTGVDRAKVKAKLNHSSVW